MKNKKLNTIFLETLNKRFPNRSELADILADLLDTDKTSIYRRLREDVRFSVDELGSIAKRFAISLDELIDNVRERDYKTMKLEMPFITDENGIIYDLLEEQLFCSEKFVNGEDSELGAALGILNRAFFIHYDQLARFFLFKWGRYYTDLNDFKRFETVEINDRFKALQRIEGESLQRFKNTFYIWDIRIIPNLVRDIKYYESIDLINSTDTQLLRDDLFQLLDDLEAQVAQGRYQETGNHFEFYTASMNIHTTHTYMHSGDHWVYFLNAFVVRSMYTVDPLVCARMKNWINTQKASSVLISESGEKERLQFFNKQRQVVEML
ncbi:hypothetical protein [Parabacteroides sp. PF5-6]|uniref:hypothetical protein n=1 Tax=Parabacteroides sp. PF5-6 TaxID=1742403 RepID=UPI002405FC69|nr:hypothetical protein [Parabacteroides sp. PF5-6]MDF9831256.1 hypothetical protein [Parabacteroides sp. PF5-6]